MYNDDNSPSNYNSVTNSSFDLGNAAIGTIGGIASAATPLLSLAGGLYDSAQNRKVARENTDKTIEAQKAEAELQYQRSVEMWNMQNLYNTPEQQMNRFKAAGLNPNLIYGQGNPGNASSPPSYQAPQQQYRYAAGNYGQAVASILPMLMQVGTWLQDMRLTEKKIESTDVGIDKAEQLIDYLKEANPEMLEKLKNQAEGLGYQAEVSKYGVSEAHVGLMQLLHEYNLKYGGTVKEGTMPYHQMSEDDQRVTKGERFMSVQKLAKELEIKGYDAKLKQAQSSWTDFGITSPQAIMQMVLGAALGFAGQTLKAPGKVAPKVNQQQKKVHTRTVTNRESGGKRIVTRKIYE